MEEFDRERIATMIADAGDIGNISAVVQTALREAYIETTQDLQTHVDKLRCLNQLKRKLREALVDLYEARASAATGDAISLKVFDFDCVRRANGWVIVETEMTVISLAELDSRIAHLETRMGLIGDDAQLANIDLQNVLQQQQQALQTMSNVSRSLHETAMAIIRNMS